MKILFFLSIILSSFSHAQVQRIGKVVLLTSFIETEDISQERNRDLEAKITRDFLKTYDKTGYKLETTHLTSPNKLWSTLNDPEVVGLLWVSHSKKSKNLGSGISDPGSVLDAFGNNVKDLFKTTTPNLKYLSIIGCEAAAILEQYQQDGRYSPTLRINGYHRKVAARSGFKKSLRESTKTLLATPLRKVTIVPKEDVPSYSIEFSGLSHLENKWIKIELGNEIVTIDKISSDSLKLQITHDFWGKVSNYNIIVSLIDEGELQEISISVNGNTIWKLFGKDGQAIGHRKNLYLYRP